MAQSRKTQFVAFLRGINVGANGKGRKNVPMVELRTLADELGFTETQTYVQSGNLIFEASIKPKTVERKLEAAIAAHFEFEVPVVVRSMGELVSARMNCPFEEAARLRPKLLHIGFAKAAFEEDCLEKLEPYCRSGERVALSGTSFWMDSEGIHGSKMTPTVLNRAFGSPVTMRNTKTLDAIVALAR